MAIIDTIAAYIGSLGFPIAACVFLALYVTKVQKEYGTQAEAMRQTIEANTSIVKALAEKIDSLKKE